MIEDDKHRLKGQLNLTLSEVTWDVPLNDLPTDYNCFFHSTKTEADVCDAVFEHDWRVSGATFADFLIV